MEPLEQVFAKEFPDYNPFPFGVQRQINRLVRHILLSEPLLQEFGECFRGISEADIHELIASFLFDQCTIRQPLAEMLRNFA
jgi:hypothetical protein